MKEWFESWFDTSYYHILYKDRDHSEAEFFIKNLFEKLALDKNETVLDLACGKGRHAIFINKMGYATTGVDLSGSSIENAKLSETKSLSFFQHDMRLPIENQQFNLVLNLFTSFGYFDEVSHNEKMLNSINSYLKDEGKLVIDFMNASLAIKKMIPFEIKTIDGIDFEISKKVENGIIIKDIRFSDKGELFHYQEKVQALKLENFEDLLKKANFEIESIYGNYQLENFDANSERLIIIAKKNNA